MVPLIESAEALAGILPLLAGPDRIAVDTEADSLHCYFEKLCLIQISIPERDFLIDPLAGFSLEPLFKLLAGKELIFHGADYDLRLLRRAGFSAPERVFDTMIAARLCGVHEFSLAALIEKNFGHQLTKGSQKANWARRPLSPQMREYAVNDTRFLQQLAANFDAELKRLERWDWFTQSCERAVRVTENSKERDPEEAWKIPGSGVLRGRAAAILRELWFWRDAEARAIDRPAFHILHNEQLIAAAHRVDQGGSIEFKHLRGARLRRFTETAERALSIPENEWPKYLRNARPRPTREEESRFRALREKRDTAAAALKLEPALIAPKGVLESVAANDVEVIARLMPWQRELLGI